eukprot:scaffold42942_cov45-Tisochrysis_lutea.AAC.3
MCGGWTVHCSVAHARTVLLECCWWRKRCSGRAARGGSRAPEWARPQLEGARACRGVCVGSLLR